MPWQSFSSSKHWRTPQQQILIHAPNHVVSTSTLSALLSSRDGIAIVYTCVRPHLSLGGRICFVFPHLRNLVQLQFLLWFKNLKVFRNFGTSPNEDIPPFIVSTKCKRMQVFEEIASAHRSTGSRQQTCSIHSGCMWLSWSWILSFCYILFIKVLRFLDQPSRVYPSGVPCVNAQSRGPVQTSATADLMVCRHSIKGVETVGTMILKLTLGRWVFLISKHMYYRWSSIVCMYIYIYL